ncbi:MAG TPA: hypothetical protein VI316_10645 [Candidatus Dormibacteraeota bacterium]
MANVVRARVQQAEAAPLFAPLSLPEGTTAIDAVWAGAGAGDALGPWIDRLLSAALRTGDTGVAHLEGSRDAVRYVLEVAGDLVAASADGAVALPGRRAAVGLTVSLDGAHVLADSWASGLSLGLSAPAEGPVVALLRRPGGDVLLASTPALPTAARTLIDQLPEAPRPPEPPLPREAAAVPAQGRPSRLRVIVALASLSLAAIVIASLHTVMGGSSQPASRPGVAAPSAVVARPPATPFLASSPPVANGVIAADPATGDLVLVGCCDGTGVTGPTVSTWSWDGGSWTHVAARTTAPPFQRGLHFVFDYAIGAFVLQGGLPQGATWTWAAGTWAEGQPGLQPPPGAVAMVYDPAMRRVVLVVPDPGDQLAQTWAWDGHVWTEIDSAGPGLNGPAALAYDTATQQLVLAGQDNFGAAVTVWTFTALRTWRHDALVAGFAYDPTMQLSWDGVSERLIAVSLGPDAVPANGATLPVDSWAWDGRSWSQLPTTGAPTEQGLLVSSADHHVLFVGVDETAAGPDVWAWTGTNWTPLRSPPPAGDGLGGFTPATSAAPPAAVP